MWRSLRATPIHTSWKIAAKNQTASSAIPMRIIVRSTARASSSWTSPGCKLQIWSVLRVAIPQRSAVHEATTFRASISWAMSAQARTPSLGRLGAAAFCASATGSNGRTCSVQCRPSQRRSWPAMFGSGRQPASVPCGKCVAMSGGSSPRCGGTGSPKDTGSSGLRGIPNSGDASGNVQGSVMPTVSPRRAIPVILRMGTSP